LPPLNR